MPASFPLYFPVCVFHAEKILFNMCSKFFSYFGPQNLPLIEMCLTNHGWKSQKFHGYAFFVFSFKFIINLGGYVQFLLKVKCFDQSLKISLKKIFNFLISQIRDRMNNCLAELSRLKPANFSNRWGRDGFSYWKLPRW